MLLLSIPLLVLLSSSGSRLSCWLVSLCQADLRNPSFLWSEALLEEVDDDDDDDDAFEDVSLFLWRIRRPPKYAKDRIWNMGRVLTADTGQDS